MQVQYVKPFNKINKHPLEKICLKSQRKNYRIHNFMDKKIIC